MRTGVGEDLHAARPRRQTGERLFVAEVDAGEADFAGDIILGGDIELVVERGIEAVEGEKLGGGVEDGAAEEIRDVAAKSADGNLADAREIIFETRVGGFRAPRLDARVVDDDAVGRIRRVAVGIGEREAAGVLVQVGSADGKIARGADDEIFPEVEGGVETGEEAEVFLFDVSAALQERELRDGEGIRRGENEQRRAVGGAEDSATGIALIVARGVGERAFGLDVGLLGTKATDEFETALEQRDVTPQKRG